MEWISALLKIIGEQALFVILIPVVLIIVTFVLLPFETIQNKLFDKMERKNGNKFVNGFLGLLGFAIGMIPLIIVIIYAFNKD